MNLRFAVISLVLLVGMIEYCRGNSPPPPQLLPASTVRTAPVVVWKADLSHRKDNVQAVVTIPRHLLGELMTGEPAIAMPLATERPTSLPWWTTVITGVMVSLAMVLLVVKVRSRKLKVLTATGVGLALLAGGQLSANLAMPSRRMQTIEIVVVDQGEFVMLTLPAR